MQTLVNKVIRASAGTGKTYRLSLEYIGLLLQYRQLGLAYNEILVITFTRKATAEIRNRIFQHLQLLCENPSGEEAKKLEYNLKDCLGVRLREEDRDYLRQVYHDMLMNKNRVEISTIDAFTNKIFVNIIAPFLGLEPRAIKKAMDAASINELNAHALVPENLAIIKSMFMRTKKRSVEDYAEYIHSIIRDRWIFHFLDQYAGGHDHLMQQTEIIDRRLQNFRAHFSRLADLLQAHALQKEKIPPLEGIVKKDYSFLIREGSDDLNSFSTYIKGKIADLDFIISHVDDWFADEPFWNKISIFNGKKYDSVRSEALEALRTAQSEIAEYFYLTLFLAEERELRRIADMLLEKYDQLTLRDKVFTHSDITYATFKHLYNPELSLLEGDSVSNSFYELLANRIRFLLIDEFQDTSVLQLKILLPIIREVSSGEGVKPYGGVIVVGDEKQSIYGWRGGERDLLLAMPGLLQVEEEPPLTKSFRSRPVIMHFINDFFANPALHESLAQRGIEWPYQRCSTSSTQDDGAVWVRFHNVSKQTNNAEDEEDAQPHTSAHNELAEEIHALIQAGKILPSQTAVLTRTNKDLDRLAAAFDELGLDYIHESSHAIPQHRAIKPMMYLLNYLAGWNFDDLLKFLRSDYILISATELKRILEAYRQINKNPSEQPIWRELAAALPECAILQRTAAAIEKSLRLDLVNLCRMILKDFAVLRKFHLENDAKNIHHFLEIVAAFCEQRQYLVTPAGFIRYCHDHRLEEELQQIGLDEVEALQLLTIHKAKGKEFENVFVFLDTTGGGRGQERGIRCYLRYGSAFRDIEEYAVTFLYDKVLQNCSMKPLYEEQKRRDAIEALNTFYVAITRAGSNLGLFMTFENKKGIEEWCKQNAKSDEVVMERMLVELLYNQLKTEERLYEKNLSGARAFIGRYAAIEQKAPTSVAKDVQFAREYLDTERRVHYRPRPLPEEDVFLNYKSMFLKKRSMDRGIVVHYYLSFIKYDSAAARQWAAQQTIAYYGSLVPVAEIRALIERADDCMARHAELFSAQHWSAAFTEYTLFAADGREQRIDRLLVSDERKEILIVDFKTGEAHDQRQLQAYIETVRSLPYVTSNGYGVRGIFVEVSL